MARQTWWRAAALALAMSLLAPAPSPAYSVLAHEAIIDAVWDQQIQPLLLARYPGTTPDQLKEARGYAYGGSIIQDLGYSPFGSHLFTNLVHYVRSGDFVAALLTDAQSPDDYAFALGAAAHYFADTRGHTIGINLALPLGYPKLRAQYGNVVPYGDAPVDHIRVEFAFDVEQVAGGAYAPEAFHNFIGFQVDKPLLERAFRETYGLEMSDIFVNEDLALGTYRRTVSGLVPQMTRVAWSQKREQIEKATPGIQRKTFVFNLSRRQYEQEFGSVYQRPGTGAAMIAFVLRVVPKIGPFRALAFHPPTPQIEALFLKSFQTTREQYAAFLVSLRDDAPSLPDDDLDTAKRTELGEYPLADETYAELLDKLAQHNFTAVTPSLRKNIVDFYSPQTPVQALVIPDKNKVSWEKTQKELEELRGTPMQGQ